VGQRIAVIFSCIGFGYLLLHQFTSNILRYAILGILILLACVEKLCSIMNMIAVERDWVRQTVRGRLSNVLVAPMDSSCGPGSETSSP
jgi:iron-regulated transporter 1